MSANSPTYQCTSGGTLTVNTTAPYCNIPGGHRRVEICCSEQGSAIPPVNFIEPCYTWCNLALSGQGDSQTQLNNAITSFSRCLETGDNSSAPVGMVCGAGGGSEEVPPTTTIASTETSMPASSSGGMPIDTSGAQAKNVKAAGLTGALLAAGMLIGGV